MPDGLKTAFCTYCGTEFIVERSSVGRTECGVCDGFGRLVICKACDGSGRCLWDTKGGIASDDLITSLAFRSHCDLGICSACGGSGRWGIGGCPGCGGTGKCPRCHGSGRCPSCHGVGILPTPDGDEVCLVCGGTGVADNDRTRDPSIGRCPACKRMWPEDGCFCPRCGYCKSCPECDAPWVVGRDSCARCGYLKGRPPRSEERGK
jgi:hypothetical protein